MSYMRVVVLNQIIVDYFITSYVLWNLRSIPVPKAVMRKLEELLNTNINMEILEPCIALYSKNSQ